MATGRVPTTANSPLTAKGDLFGYSTTQARVAVGNDGETLVADSSATTGLRYSATPSASNPVLNSAFQIWQRGTSVAQTGSATFTADRWCSLRATGTTGSTVSRQVTGDTTNLPNIQYAARVQRDSANTVLSKIFFANSFETINSIPFVGKTVTMSFYARKGANYSSASDALETKLIYGTGTDQNNLTAYTGEVDVINQTTTLTTTWQRFSYSGTVSTSATELTVRFAFTPVGTAGAADYFEVTGVQLDIGSVALPFRTYGGTIQGELAACQRYYFRLSGTNVIPYTAYARDTTGAYVSVTYPSVMRVAPTALDYSALELNLPGTANYTITVAALNTPANNATTLELTASGLTQYRPYLFKTSSAGYVGFSAEL